MKMTKSRRFRLDAILSQTRCLLDDGVLDKVQNILRDHAPKWATGLHISRHRGRKTPIDVSVPGALAEALRTRATERGPLYHTLERELGRGLPARIQGTAEIRGADDSLVVVISIDEASFRRAGANWICGNDIALQVCRSQIEGSGAIEWTAAVLESLAAGVSPIYGRATMLEEFYAKNMSDERDTIQAVGVDLTKSLPGLYWMNFLGAPYRDLLGKRRLLDAPAHSVKEVDEGILLSLGSDPRYWNSPEYGEVEQRVLDHLGRQFFYSKHAPDRQTMAPDFGLAPVH